MVKILVIDDDLRFVHLLCNDLVLEGYEVCKAEDGHKGLRLAYEQKPDLILLDIMMSKLDGWRVCQRLRELTDVPIIMLTALGDKESVVKGLNAGADDYVAKPFSLAELKARITAALRRAKRQNAVTALVYEDDALVIDLTRDVVRKRGTPLRLTPKERALLASLLRRLGQVVSHETLLREVWGSGYERQTSYLNLYIRYLRKKIEDDPDHPRYVRTHPRVGYSFEPAAADSVFFPSGQGPGEC